MTRLISLCIAVSLSAAYGAQTELVIYKNDGATVSEAVADIDSIKFISNNIPFADDFSAGTDSWELTGSADWEIVNEELKASAATTQGKGWGMSSETFWTTDFTLSAKVSMPQSMVYQQAAIGLMFLDEHGDTIGSWEGMTFSIRRQAGVKKYELRGEVINEVYQVNYDWNYDTFYTLTIAKSGDTWAFLIDGDEVESFTRAHSFAAVRLSLYAYETIATWDDVSLESN